MTNVQWLDLLGLLAPMLLVLGVYELLFVLPLRSRNKRLIAALLELDRTVVGLERGVRAQTGQEQRLTRRIERLAERLGQLELRSESRPYEQAINLAARGGGVERLISYFGLTEGEASLVRLLHGRSKPDHARGRPAPVDTP